MRLNFEFRLNYKTTNLFIIQSNALKINYFAYFFCCYFFA